MEGPLSAQSLQAEVEGLPDKGRLAFLLSIAERLYPNYAAFSRSERWGDPSQLRHAMDLGWAALAGNQVNTSAIEGNLSRLESVTPDTERSRSPLVSAALDAAVCGALVLEFLLGGEAEKILEAASLARDTVDMYVQELTSLDAQDPLLEGKILRHPLMQRELGRQKSDLNLLRQLDWTQPDTAAALRTKWRAPAVSNIDIAA